MDSNRTIWVVYEWHSGEEMSEECIGHFSTKAEAIKVLQTVGETWLDPNFHIQFFDIKEEYCPRCGERV